jgi:hypothetical protein
VHRNVQRPGHGADRRPRDVQHLSGSTRLSLKRRLRVPLIKRRGAARLRSGYARCSLLGELPQSPIAHKKGRVPTWLRSRFIPPSTRE